MSSVSGVRENEGARPTEGFQSMKTAYANIKGFEAMRMIRKRQCIMSEPGVRRSAIVNNLFDLAA